MYFDNIQQLLEMDGHGFYVWLSYLVPVLLFIIFALSTYAKQRSFFHKQRRRLRDQALIENESRG